MIEDEDTIDGESGGFYAGEDTQHCVGYIIMRLHEDGGSPWPGINNDDDLLERICQRVDFSAPVFQRTEDFIAANAGKEDER